jgi:hypothetical protein
MLTDMEIPAILRSPDSKTATARALAALGGILLILGATGPLASFGVGFAAKDIYFRLISAGRVDALVAIGTATVVLAILGRTRWFVWSGVAILVTFGSMVSLDGEKSSVEMPGWLSEALGSIAKGALNLVTFHYGTPCLALGILLIIGVGAWRCRAPR